jgi:hypothetical protein
VTRRLLAPLSRPRLAALLAPLTALLAGCPPSEPTCEDRGEVEISWFLDRDRDGFGDRSVSILACSDQDPSETQPDQYVTDATDCDDLRPESFPQGIELCDGLDNNCNGAIDDGLPFNDFWIDADGDGYGDPALQIEACSVPDDGATRPGDCDDSNPDINRDAVEICDGIDNDCDALIDDEDVGPALEGGVDLTTGLPWRPDDDGDSFGDWNEEEIVFACEQPVGFVADASDCNDADPVINPTNQEICDGIDNDCDQLFDDSDPSLDVGTQTEWFQDVDADGHGVPTVSLLTCTTPWFYALTADDCDDSDPEVRAADNTVWVEDLDGDGFGAPGTETAPSCTPPGPTFVPAIRGLDCDDAEPLVNPAEPEVCDTLDNDCDGLVDDDDIPFDNNGFPIEGGVDITTMTVWFTDGDADGFGDPNLPRLACLARTTEVDNGADCADIRPDINPAATEVCNGIDDDCDQLVDDFDDTLDLDSGTLYTRDADGDGIGNLNDVFRSCQPLDGYVEQFGDCDDTDPAIGLPSNWWLDADGDGQGAGEVFAPASCDPPSVDHVPWYVDLEPDCDPDDALRMSGEEICYDGIDQGCNDIDFNPTANCSVELPVTCPMAETFTPIEAVDGETIRITFLELGIANNLDTSTLPAMTCFTNSTPVAAGGPERILPIRVPAGMQVTLRYQLFGGDGVVYLLDDCNNVDTCIIGSNVRATNSGLEGFNWTNTTAADVTKYLVLDGADFNDDGSFNVQIDGLFPVSSIP